MYVYIYPINHIVYTYHIYVYNVHVHFIYMNVNRFSAKWYLYAHVLLPPLLLRARSQFERCESGVFFFTNKVNLSNFFFFLAIQIIHLTTVIKRFDIKITVNYNITVLKLLNNLNYPTINLLKCKNSSIKII